MATTSSSFPTCSYFEQQYNLSEPLSTQYVQANPDVSGIGVRFHKSPSLIDTDIPLGPYCICCERVWSGLASYRRIRLGTAPRIFTPDGGQEMFLRQQPERDGALAGIHRKSSFDH